VSDLPLAGDADGLYMACPAGPAAELAELLPPGPVLELCCGVGGLTKELAKAGRKVLAVDISLERLRANRANLAAMGLQDQVSHLCCDLSRPALRALQGAPRFAASVLDPDWSPPGENPGQWTHSLADMEPPADGLIRLGLGMSPLVVIRLPREIKSHSLKSRSGLACRELGGGGKRWRWMALSRPSS
jgi:SAM-dependent methyltransferase